MHNGPRFPVVLFLLIRDPDSRPASPSLCNNACRRDRHAPRLNTTPRAPRGHFILSNEKKLLTIGSKHRPAESIEKPSGDFRERGRKARPFGSFFNEKHSLRTLARLRFFPSFKLTKWIDHVTHRLPLCPAKAYFRLNFTNFSTPLHAWSISTFLSRFPTIVSALFFVTIIKSRRYFSMNFFNRKKTADQVFRMKYTRVALSSV